MHPAGPPQSSLTVYSAYPTSSALQYQQDMADDKVPPRQILPRLRVTSHSFADVSNGSIANVTQRTVSSSSMMSTPSNNIRRVQQRNGFRQRSTNPELRAREIPAGGNATRKILNLQQLKKTYLNPKPFVLRKPINMTKYDYSVFADHAAALSLDEDELPPPIKESQIRAWESAEKISSNLIFENAHPPSSGKFGIFEDASKDMDISVDDEVQADAETSINRGSSIPGPQSSDDTIQSIPGFTKGELKILNENFDLLKNSSGQVDPVDFEDTLANALWVYRQLESASQERAFMAHHTISGKRNVQVYHKKEFLRKLFGYSNNVNIDFITNNTSYSAFDNVANVQKVFHEDKDEMLGLLEEDKLFEEAIRDTRTNQLANNTESAGGRVDSEPDVDNSHLLHLTQTWLTSNYINENDSDDICSGDSFMHGDDRDQEMVTFTMAHLKRCIKDACE